jgi:hypothetical protein
MMTTLSQVIKNLKEQGYSEDFNLKDSCLECSARKINLNPEEFEVDSTYRFEGTSDPSDSAIAYAISSEKHGLKGVLVNSYGAYADPVVAKLAAKLQIVRGDEDRTDL